jgi:hypothetical protein
MNGAIESRIATGGWLIVGAVLASWFSHRRREARRLLRGDGGTKPSRGEADAIQTRLMVDAFLVGGCWLALFLILDWLF